MKEKPYVSGWIYNHYDIDRLWPKLHRHQSNGFCCGRDKKKRVLSLQMSSDCDKEMMSIYTKRFYIVEERRKETEEKFTHDYPLPPPPRQNRHFWTYVEKTITSTFGCMVTSPVWSTFDVHPVKGPKAISRNTTKNVWPWEKCLMTRDNFTVHDVNKPLKQPTTTGCNNQPTG